MKCGWIIFDEFLFMSPRVFEALLPTFATHEIVYSFLIFRGAAGSMISSLSPEGNNPIMAILYSKYRDGSDVFKILNWSQVKNLFKLIQFYDNETVLYHLQVLIDKMN